MHKENSYPQYIHRNNKEKGSFVSHLGKYVSPNNSISDRVSMTGHIEARSKTEKRAVKSTDTKNKSFPFLHLLETTRMDL